MCWGRKLGNNGRRRREWGSMRPRTLVTLALVCAVPVCASWPDAVAQSSIPGWLGSIRARRPRGGSRRSHGRARHQGVRKTTRRAGSAMGRCQGARVRSNRRRLIAATFALEAIRPAMERIVPTPGSPVAAPILEWACQLLRTTPAPLPAERWWHLAAVALIERSFNQDPLTGHSSREDGRNPTDPGRRPSLRHSVARFP